MPRRGYRFVAPVARVPGPAEEIPSLPDIAVRVVAAKAPGVNVKRAALLVTALVGVVLGAGAAWRVHRPSARPPEAATRAATTQLAVMPFRVLGDPGRDSTYLGIGIADAITTRLAATRLRSQQCRK